MKGLRITAWSFFGIGLLFKSMHWPGGSVLAILGALLLLIFSSIHFIKNKKEGKVDSFINLSVALATTYLLFRIQYWSFANVIFIVNLLSILLVLVAVIRSKSKLNLFSYLVIVYSLLTIPLYFAGSHHIYYAMNYGSITHEAGVDNYYNHKVLDRYSWFLIRNGKKEDALKYNDIAHKAAEKFLEESTVGYDEFDAKRAIEVIEEHRRKLESNAWDLYLHQDFY